MESHCLVNMGRIARVALVVVLECCVGMASGSFQNHLDTTFFLQLSVQNPQALRAVIKTMETIVRMITFTAAK